MKTLAQPIAKLACMLARPTLFFYLLPWLMVLLVMGTVAQRYLGLYQSQKLFFGSFILWLGQVPTPGAYTVLTLIAASLTAKLLLKSPYKKKTLGTLITHISALVLFAGALVSTLSREEGYMVLGEGETGSVVHDYYNHELAVLKNDQLLFTVPQGELSTPHAIARKELPFTMELKQYCYNCAVTQVSGEFALNALPRDSQEERNHSGVIFTVQGKTYTAFEGAGKQPQIIMGNDRYTIAMRAEERSLPFAVTLKQFTKEDYPGTDMARRYSSDVLVKDQALVWPARIEMNQPLRLHGYTLYQSSFVDSEGKLSTVLAVVKNAGALFPYIAITMLCVGLLVHLFLIFASKKRA